jgi:pectate lyase
MLKDIKINKVENEPFLIQQVQNVELKNVTIENKSYDGIYNKRDKKSKPKQKI